MEWVPAARDELFVVAGALWPLRLTCDKPVGLNIPVDLLMKNSKAGGGDIHTNGDSTCVL